MTVVVSVLDWLSPRSALWAAATPSWVVPISENQGTAPVLDQSRNGAFTATGNGGAGANVTSRPKPSFPVSPSRAMVGRQMKVFWSWLDLVAAKQALVIEAAARLVTTRCRSDTLASCHRPTVS